MERLVELHNTVNGPMYLVTTDTVISESLRQTGDYAPEEKSLLGELITSGATVVDVGANVGNHTLFFSQQVGDNGRVLSFEPQRFLFQVLCANSLLGQFRNIWPYRVAVGDAQGAVDIPVPNYDRPNDFGGYSLECDTFKEPGEITTLDALSLSECHLIKIDVEGMELSVLKGAQATIRLTKPFLYFDDNRAEFRDEIVTFAHEVLDYRLYRHGPNVVAHHRTIDQPHVLSKMIELPRGKAVAPTNPSPIIYVSVACFCDPDVVETVKNLFAKATDVARIFVGVCLQAMPEDRRFDELSTLSGVSVDRINVEQARGPIYARARCESMVGDAEYFLQIDCHSRFFEGWDQILIEELALAERSHPRAVLSHYPINIKNMHSDEYLDRIGHVNRYRQVDRDDLKSHGSLVKLPQTPLPSLGISAAMLFMRSTDRKAIGYDPALDFGLHAAEQVLYAIRLWTHGFDVFCPTRHAVATDYVGSRDRIPPEAKRISNANRGDWPDATWSKVKFLLGLDTREQVDSVYAEGLAGCLKHYGLGDTRTLLEYFQFAGIHDDLKRTFPNYIYSDD
jgi:FkbM family methyltransferase